MVSFPNAKINIGLNIIGKRPDGFHNLNTIFYPIGIRDAIEIIEDHNNQNQIDFSQTGIPIPGDDTDNLCIKAYQLLKNDFPQLPNIQMHLHKSIPMGAGLGGGSADGAFILKLVNDKFNLGLNESQLIKYALELGSDCPFFIKNKPCFAEGRGEILNEISLDLSNYKILIVNPGIHINTGWAFNNLKITGTETNLQQAITKDITTWKDSITNDFETPVIKAHPGIGEIKNQLYNSGALYSSMSGSGSTVFGIFKNKPTEAIKFPEAYFYKWV